MSKTVKVRIAVAVDPPRATKLDQDVEGRER